MSIAPTPRPPGGEPGPRPIRSPSASRRRALGRATRRGRAVVVAAVFAALVTAPVLAASTTSIVAAAPDLPADPLETRLLDAANEARLDAGVPGLAFDAGLARAARNHAREMADLGYFSHTSPTPETSTLSRRVARSGAPYVSIAENLALLRGEPDVARAAVDGWLASPGHRRNLLDARFDVVGFGVARAADGTVYVAQEFADAPRALLGVAVAPSATQVHALDLSIRLADVVAVPTDVLVAVDDQPGRVVRTDARELASELVLEGSDPASVQIGLPDGTGFRLAAEVRVWPTTGAYAATFAGDGRAHVAAIETSPSGLPSQRLTLHYGAGTESLTVLVDGRERPSAARGDGVYAVDLEGGRDHEILVGVRDGGRIAVFHAFRLRWDGPVPRLLAGRSGP